MAKPIAESTFALDGSIDTTATLFGGKGSMSSMVLTQDLSDSETEVFYVDSANGAPVTGFAVIEEEVIFYGQQNGHYEVRFLQRGFNDTTPVEHLTGTEVLLTPVYYIPPALIDAIITLQTRVVGVEGRVETLEGG